MRAWWSQPQTDLLFNCPIFSVVVSIVLNKFHVTALNCLCLNLMALTHLHQITNPRFSILIERILKWYIRSSWQLSCILNSWTTYCSVNVSKNSSPSLKRYKCRYHLLSLILSWCSEQVFKLHRTKLLDYVLLRLNVSLVALLELRQPPLLPIYVLDQLPPSLMHLSQPHFQPRPVLY